MPQRPTQLRIEARHLTKRYGTTTAVNDLSFDVRPGLVTGFIGPNGAGKTTTMRMILDLDHPSGGTVTVGGQRYRDLQAPMRTVGALIDAKAVHPGCSAHNHLLSPALSNGIPAARVAQVLGLVGLDTDDGSAVSPSACASGSESPRHCSATRWC
jgi:ABC-2 type transport system ATP-binding protein